MDLVLRDFRGRWLRIRAQNSENQNSGFNMANEDAKSYLIAMIFGSRKFWGCWLRPELKIQKFKIEWIQLGWPKCKKPLDWGKIWNSGLVEVADYESELDVHKFKMTNPLWLTKMQKATRGKEFGTLGLLKSLITNPSSTFRNSKWRIQYSWPKCKK